MKLDDEKFLFALVALLAIVGLTLGVNWLPTIAGTLPVAFGTITALAGAYLASHVWAAHSELNADPYREEKLLPKKLPDLPPGLDLDNPH